MNRTDLDTRSDQWGNFAYGIVLLAGYLVWLTSGAPLEMPRLISITLLCLVCWGLGTWGEQYLRLHNWKRFYPAYLAIQLVLGASVTVISQGMAWLVLLPLASQAMQNIRLKWALVFCVVIWAAQVVPIAIFYGPRNLSAFGLPLLAAIVFVAVFTQISNNEHQTRLALSDANRKLRDYALQAEELATTQERNRLAREIHDGLGHYLTAIHIQVKAAGALVEQNPVQAREALTNAQNLAEEALADVRRSISSLRTDPTTGRPLPELIENLLSETRSVGIACELKVEGSPTLLSPQAEFTLYRAAQEALTNIRKHSHATQAVVEIKYGALKVQLRVCDNGAGASLEDSDSAGFGLTGLRERIQLAGGTLNLESAPGKGFCVTVEVPALRKNQS